MIHTAAPNNIPAKIVMRENVHASPFSHFIYTTEKQLSKCVFIAYTRWEKKTLVYWDFKQVHFTGYITQDYAMFPIKS